MNSWPRLIGASVLLTLTLLKSLAGGCPHSREVEEEHVTVEVSGHGATLARSRSCPPPRPTPTPFGGKGRSPDLARSPQTVRGTSGASCRGCWASPRSPVMQD